MTLESDAKFEQKLVLREMTLGIWQIFTRAHKTVTFIEPFYPK